MALRINDLGLVLEEVYDTSWKWYKVGLMLRVPVRELDSIDHQYADKHDKLLQMLKTWLPAAEKPTWQSIVSALRSRVVGEQKLACHIEARYQQLPIAHEKSIPVLTWQTSEAPDEFSRGTAVSDGKMAYFNCGGSTKVYAYDSQSQEWSRLPNCLPLYSCLAIVQGMLTTIGGIDGSYTNSLLSLMGEGSDRKWSEHYPRMPTKRRYPATICSGRALIVAGGACEYILTAVEVLDTDTMQWSIANSLPCPLTFATAAVCGDRLYLLGGNDDFSVMSQFMTRTVLTSSIPELLESCHLNWPAAKRTIWRLTADVPLYHSTCANLCGRLVAVGGRTEDIYDERILRTAAIFVYDETTNSWQAQQDMPTARENALVAVFPGKLMVVGGLGQSGLLHKVDMATFS